MTVQSLSVPYRSPVRCSSTGRDFLIYCLICAFPPVCMTEAELFCLSHRGNITISIRFCDMHTVILLIERQVINLASVAPNMTLDPRVILIHLEILVYAYIQSICTLQCRLRQGGRCYEDWLKLRFRILNRQQNRCSIKLEYAVFMQQLFLRPSLALDNKCSVRQDHD